RHDEVIARARHREAEARRLERALLTHRALERFELRSGLEGKLVWWNAMTESFGGQRCHAATPLIWNCQRATSMVISREDGRRTLVQCARRRVASAGTEPSADVPAFRARR